MSGTTEIPPARAVAPGTSPVRPAPRLHRGLSHPLWLGLFSCSVYLIHLPLVIVLGGYASARLPNTALVLFMLLLVLPLVVGLGYLFHLLFERPFMNAPRTE